MGLPTLLAADNVVRREGPKLGRLRRLSESEEASRGRRLSE
jgi:hypothetical protein